MHSSAAVRRMVALTYIHVHVKGTKVLSGSLKRREAGRRNKDSKKKQQQQQQLKTVNSRLLNKSCISRIDNYCESSLDKQKI